MDTEAFKLFETAESLFKERKLDGAVQAHQEAAVKDSTFFY